jgi:tetratricopeptide (TPR) repeat protein
MARLRFVETLKANAVALAAVTAFLAAAAALSAAFGGGSSVALLVAATIVLLSYNMWLWRVRRSTIPALRERPGARLRRYCVHGGSAIALVAAWAVAGLLLYPPAAFPLKIAVLGCRSQLPPLTAYLADGEPHQFRLEWSRYDCLGQVGRYEEQATTARQLLANNAAWDSESEPRRSREMAVLHITASRASGLTDGEIATEARKAADLLPDDPRVLPLAAFSTVVGTERGNPATLANIRRLLSHAEEMTQGWPSAEAKKLREWRLFWGGRAFRSAGFAAEAEQQFAELLSSESPSVMFRDNALVQFGILQYLRTKDLDKAKETWRKVNDLTLLAPAFSVTAVDIAHQAQEARDTGQSERAASLADEADKLASVAGGLAQGRDSVVDFQTAIVQYMNGRSSEALATLEALEKRSPRHPDYAYWAGRAAFDAKDMAVARKSFERVLELDPLRADGAVWLGRVHQKLGDIAEAKRYFLRAEQIAPDLPEALLWTATVYAEELERAHTFEEKIAVGQQALAYVIRAKATATSKNEQVTLRDINVFYPLILNNLAYTYADDADHLGLAREYATQALSMKPEYPDAMGTMAYVLIREVQLGQVQNRDAQLQAATDYLEKALQKFGLDETESRAEAFADAGMVAELRGDSARARRYELDALGLDPANAHALKALGRASGQATSK